MPQRTPVAEWRALRALAEPGETRADTTLRAGIESLLLKKPGDQIRIGQLLKDWRHRNEVAER